MSKNHEEQDKLMMNTMYWWGIPSFFKCNFQENIENTDIALLECHILQEMVPLRETSIWAKGCETCFR